MKEINNSTNEKETKIEKGISGEEFEKKLFENKNDDISIDDLDFKDSEVIRESLLNFDDIEKFVSNDSN